MLGNWKERVLTISIALMLLLFVGYSIHTFLLGETDSESYVTTLLIIASISGVVSITVGMILKNETVGTGLVAGGILSILYGIVRHWEYSDNLLKVIVIGGCLAVLIWLGFKYFG